jgi:hypothetical protein
MVPVPAKFIRELLLKQQTLDWAKIRIAAESTNTDETVRALATTALAVLTEAGESDVDFSDADVAALFNQVVAGLQTVGLVNPSVAPQILAQSARSQSWEQFTGIPVTSEVVAQVLAEIRAGN